MLESLLRGPGKDIQNHITPRDQACYVHHCSAFFISANRSLESNEGTGCSTTEL